MSDVRHWVPTGLDALELLALLTITYISLVGGLHSIGNTSWQMSLLSSISWDPPCNPGFTFIASYKVFSGASSHGDFSTAIIYLASMALWNHRGRIHDPPHSSIFNASIASTMCPTQPSLTADLG